MKKRQLTMVVVTMVVVMVVMVVVVESIDKFIFKRLSLRYRIDLETIFLNYNL